MFIKIGESSISNIQDGIFNIPYKEKPNFLSLPLTHIISRGEAFREKTKVFHSLFPHACSLNSLVQLLYNSMLSLTGVKIIEVFPKKTLNINSWLIF